MFSTDALERSLLDLNHPEMPKSRPAFKLHVAGKEGWSWADIEPNWKYDESNLPTSNPWNEVARERTSKES